jgi:hypothetical protein
MQQLTPIQFNIAHALALEFGHAWAIALAQSSERTAEQKRTEGEAAEASADDRAPLYRYLDAARIVAAGAERGTVSLWAITEAADAYHVAFSFERGIMAPSLAAGSVVHTTTTGRLSWAVSPEGNVTLEVWRPGPGGRHDRRKVLAVYVAQGDAQNPTARAWIAGPFEQRHVSALVQALEASFARSVWEDVIAPLCAACPDREEYVTAIKDRLEQLRAPSSEALDVLHASGDDLVDTIAEAEQELALWTRAPDPTPSSTGFAALVECLHRASFRASETACRAENLFYAITAFEDRDPNDDVHERAGIAAILTELASIDLDGLMGVLPSRHELGVWISSTLGVPYGPPAANVATGIRRRCAMTIGGILRARDATLQLAHERISELEADLVHVKTLHDIPIQHLSKAVSELSTRGRTLGVVRGTETIDEIVTKMLDMVEAAARPPVAAVVSASCQDATTFGPTRPPPPPPPPSVMSNVEQAHELLLDNSMDFVRRIKTSLGIILAAETNKLQNEPAMIIGRVVVDVGDRQREEPSEIVETFGATFPISGRDDRDVTYRVTIEQLLANPRREKTS